LLEGEKTDQGGGVGVRRGAASPASAAGVNGGGGEVGEEDEEMREEAWKAGREATTRLFYVRCSVKEWRPL